MRDKLQKMTVKVTADYGKGPVSDVRQVWPGALGNAVSYFGIKKGVKSFSVETSDVESLGTWMNDYGNVFAK